MDILNRKISLSVLPAKLWTLIVLSFNAILLFKNPLSLLTHYMKCTAENNLKVTFRDGRTLFLSSNKEDLTTLIVVFCKKVYGDIPKGGTLIDLGANIGFFALYAAFNGANKVYCVEPNSESFNCLRKNIRENGLEDVIIPIQKAISVHEGEMVKIPVQSSPLNKISRHISGDSCQGFELVETTTIKNIINKYSIENVDLLKIDCEGVEYEIIPSIQADTYHKIKEIKLEFHRTVEPIVSHLQKYDFKLTKLDHRESCLWFFKMSSPPIV